MNRKHIPSVSIWLWTVCALILLMVAVGGITRLTESGLSMVDWRPVTGTLPPLSAEAWEMEFAKYQESPQFAHFDAQSPMSLSEFKPLFFWEYLHRLLGRLVGLVYAIPFVYFMLRRRLTAGIAAHLTVAFFLGLGQGFMGWFMVKSGLVDQPYVSHFRLAAHLSLALVLLAYLFWILLELNPYETHRKTNYHSVRGLRAGATAFLALLFVQIVYGAFVAGLDAGRMYPEYPMMGAHFFPADGWSDRWEPAVLNLLSNPATVQFVHRHLGLLLVLLLIVLWTTCMRLRLMERQRLAFNLMFSCGIVQFMLGLFTLVLNMPIPVAVAHQVTACLLLLTNVLAIHALREPKMVTSRLS